MNRDASKGVPPYAPPAQQRDPRSLRSQLTRAVGDALRAVRNSKTAASSRQRLNDMLWNDRTLLASARAVVTGQADTDEVTNPRGSLPSADIVEVASDGEVAEWFDAALEEVVDRPTDPQTADNFAAAIESAAEDVPRRNGSAPTARQAPPAPAAAVTWEPLRPRSLTPVQLTAATGATRARKSTPAKLAAPPVTAAPSKAVAPDDDDEGGEEPIQTRSMARLLAMQGHRRRALAIYEALLRADAADASLRAEADALRQSG